jgi:hypothetical protein
MANQTSTRVVGGSNGDYVDLAAAIQDLPNWADTVFAGDAAPRDISTHSNMMVIQLAAGTHSFTSQLNINTAVISGETGYVSIVAEPGAECNGEFKRSGSAIVSWEGTSGSIFYVVEQFLRFEDLSFEFSGNNGQVTLDRNGCRISRCMFERNNNSSGGSVVALAGTPNATYVPATLEDSSFVLNTSQFVRLFRMDNADIRFSNLTMWNQAGSTDLIFFKADTRDCNLEFTNCFIQHRGKGTLLTQEQNGNVVNKTGSGNVEVSHSKALPTSICLGSQHWTISTDVTDSSTGNQAIWDESTLRTYDPLIAPGNDAWQQITSLVGTNSTDIQGRTRTTNGFNPGAFESSAGVAIVDSETAVLDAKATSITVDVPGAAGSTLTAGDLLVLVVGYDEADSDPLVAGDVTSGWNFLDDFGSVSEDVHIAVYWRIADASETTVTVTNTSEYYAAVVYQIRGHDPTAPLSAVLEEGYGASDTDPLDGQVPDVTSPGSLAFTVLATDGNDLLPVTVGSPYYVETQLSAPTVAAADTGLTFSVAKHSSLATGSPTAAEFTRAGQAGSQTFGFVVAPELASSTGSPVVEGSATSISSGSTTSIVANMPASIQSGELLLLIIASDVDTSLGDQLTTPTGWAFEVEVGDSSADCVISVFSRVAGASEASTVTVTSTVTALRTSEILRVSNTDSVHVIGPDAVGSSLGGRVTPSVTTTEASTLVLSLGAHAGSDGGQATADVGLHGAYYTLDTVISNPTASDSSGVSYARASRQMATTGVSGQSAFIWSAGDGRSSFQLALAPPTVNNDATAISESTVMAASVTAAGLTLVPGTGTLTTSAASLSAQGNSGDTTNGSGSLVISAAELAAAGQSTVPGTSSSSLAPVTAASVGQTITDADGSLTLGAATGTASGQSIVSGSAAASVGSTFLVGAGNVVQPGSGSGSLALAGVSGAASGNQTITGSANLSVAASALSANAGATTEGSSSSQLGATTLTAAGSLTVSGVGDLSVGAVTLSGQAVLVGVARGQGDLVLGFSGSGSASNTVTGQGNLSLSPTTAFGLDFTPDDLYGFVTTKTPRATLSGRARLRAGNNQVIMHADPASISAQGVMTNIPDNILGETTIIM